MGERDIEKYFKDELKGYSKDVDTNALWEALDLDKKRKKSRALVWTVGVSITAILIVVYYCFDRINFHSELQSSTPEFLVEQNESNVISIDSAIINSNIAENKSQKIVSVNSKKETSFNENIINKEIQKDIDKNETMSGKMSLTDDSFDLLINDPVDSYNTNKWNGTASSLSEEILSSINLNAEAEKNEEAKISMDGSIHSSNSSISLDILLPSTLEIKYAQPFAISKRVVAKPMLNERDLLDENSNRALRLNIYAGIYHIGRTLTTDNVELESFVNRKKESESPLELISAGIQLRYDIGSLYLKGGIEFQSLNTKFQYEQYSIIDTVAMSGVVGVLIDSNGNSFNQMGTVYEENSVTSNWTHYNSHRLFNIPVGIGYEKRFHRWSFSIEAQSQLNIRHSFSGKRLDQEGNVTDSVDDINRSFNMGLGAAIGLRYDFNHTTSIYVSPNYFRFLDSFTSLTTAYSEKYSLLGLQMGLSYQLF